MKHFSEISLIATVSFIGELLHYLIPLPVPSSIYGLLLMLLLLVTHIVKLDHVKNHGRLAHHPHARHVRRSHCRSHCKL